MSYIDLIKKFWVQHNAYSLTVTDTALYFYLLETNNLCRWEDTFNRNNNKIMADLNISFPTLSKSRNRLKQIELIDFKTKNGSAVVKYTLKKSFKVSNEVALEVIDVVGNEVSNEVSPLLYNVHVEDKDKDKDNSLSHVCRYEDISQDVFDKSLDECYIEIRDDKSWMEAVCINTRSSGYGSFTPEIFYSKLEEFFMKLQNEGEHSKSPKDAKSHFARWLKLELEKLKNNGKKFNSKIPRNNTFTDTVSSENESRWSTNGPTGDLKELIDGLQIGR